MSGSYWGDVKFVTGSCWGHVRVILGSFQGYFRSCWGHVRVMTGSFQSGIISFVKFTHRLETEGFSVLLFLSSTVSNFSYQFFQHTISIIEFSIT